MVRYETAIVNERVFVTDGEDRVPVGDLGRIVDAVGGPAWTITYSEYEKTRYTDLDTADEGLTVDVVDTINAMTFDEAFVETLRAQPPHPVSDEEEMSPRLGLFVGRLFENLEYGVR